MNSPEKVAAAPVYRVGDLTVDVGRATVARDGRDVALPKLSFDLLLALIDAAPRVVTHDELMNRVWPGLVVGPETVSQRVKLLRDSLDDDPKAPRYIVGVRGRGYRIDGGRHATESVRRHRDCGTSVPAPAAPTGVASARLAGCRGRPRHCRRLCDRVQPHEHA